MPETHTREIRGVRLFERRVGQGELIVVLHGGAGRSPVPRDVPVGWREQVEDLEALRQTWQLEQLTIAGYSWGGLLALLYAIEYQNRVRRLALISPAPAWRAGRGGVGRRFSEGELAPQLQR